MSNRKPRSHARAQEPHVGLLIGRQLLPLMAVGLAFWLLRDRLPELDFAAVWDAVHLVNPQQWGLAAVATLVSFWAVARYDQMLHGLLDTNVSRQQARRSGAVAVAIAQFAGFGVLSSALVRWRLLPGLSLAAALRISLAVSLSFLAGWAVMTAGVVLITGFEPTHLRAIFWGVLGLTAVVVLVLALQPKALPKLPGLQAVFAIISLALVDTLFASAALYVLLPPELAIAPAALLVAYLVALGCGLVGGTPGGVGPFELALLAMLPTAPHEPLLAAALAFRIIYYVVPAALGFLVLMRGPFKSQKELPIQASPPQRNPYLNPAPERHIWGAGHAEVNLVRQGQFALLSGNNAPTALIAPVGQSLVMMADPMDPSLAPGNILQQLRERGARVLRAPIVYKCAPRTAVAARRMGWNVLPVAREAWLRPQAFSTDGPKQRQLRRKLRQATRAGIRVCEGGRSLPLDDMQAISDLWAGTHGGERGFSMGRFGRDYVSCQRVFLAYRGDDLVAFITLHEVQREWTLDLMRHAPAVPDGTMHLLVCRAIDSAAAGCCPRLSLAAIPHGHAVEAAPIAWMRRRLINSSQTDGLRRFKASFDPEWTTLYAGAPTGPGLAFGLWAIYSRVNRPHHPDRDGASCSL